MLVVTPFISRVLSTPKESNTSFDYCSYRSSNTLFVYTVEMQLCAECVCFVL